MSEVLSGWIDSTLANRIGLTLVHFLWQGMLVAILVWLIVAVFRKKSANLKYTVFVGGLLTMVVCAVVTFFVMGAYVQRDSVPSVSGSTIIGNLPKSDNQNDLADMSDDNDSEATELSGVGESDLAVTEGDLSASTLETNALVSGNSPDIKQSNSLSVWEKATPFVTATYLFGQNI